eukprot:TRINITY_DN1123_c0_g1_i1.p1 TRINITY_DN1123_c0_g1~~TRINITY_DN1123_c0_g1_i1.p1  ORF type:complete len:1255 (-),score=392.55 TRINITY_DN1123_c0_g1_i1:50-3814(-)
MADSKILPKTKLSSTDASDSPAIKSKKSRTVELTQTPKASSQDSSKLALSSPPVTKSTTKKKPKKEEGTTKFDLLSPLAIRKPKSRSAHATLPATFYATMDLNQEGENMANEAQEPPSKSTPEIVVHKEEKPQRVKRKVQKSSTIDNKLPQQEKKIKKSASSEKLSRKQPQPKSSYEPIPIVMTSENSTKKDKPKSIENKLSTPRSTKHTDSPSTTTKQSTSTPSVPGKHVPSSSPYVGGKLKSASTPKSVVKKSSASSNTPSKSSPKVDGKHSHTTHSSHKETSKSGTNVEATDNVAGVYEPEAMVKYLMNERKKKPTRSDSSRAKSSRESTKKEREKKLSSSVSATTGPVEKSRRKIHTTRPIKVTSAHNTHTNGSMSMRVDGKSSMNDDLSTNGSGKSNKNNTVDWTTLTSSEVLQWSQTSPNNYFFSLLQLECLYNQFSKESEIETFGKENGFGILYEYLKKIIPTSSTSTSNTDLVLKTFDIFLYVIRNCSKPVFEDLIWSKCDGFLENTLDDLLIVRDSLVKAKIFMLLSALLNQLKLNQQLFASHGVKDVGSLFLHQLDRVAYHSAESRRFKHIIDCLQFDDNITTKQSSLMFLNDVINSIQLLETRVALRSELESLNLDYVLPQLSTDKTSPLYSHIESYYLHKEADESAVNENLSHINENYDLTLPDHINRVNYIVNAASHNSKVLKLFQETLKYLCLWKTDDIDGLPKWRFLYTIASQLSGTNNSINFNFRDEIDLLYLFGPSLSGSINEQALQTHIRLLEEQYNSETKFLQDQIDSAQSDLEQIKQQYKSLESDYHREVSKYEEKIRLSRIQFDEMDTFMDEYESIISHYVSREKNMDIEINALKQELEEKNDLIVSMGEDLSKYESNQSEPVEFLSPRSTKVIKIADDHSLPSVPSDVSSPDSAGDKLRNLKLKRSISKKMTAATSTAVQSLQPMFDETEWSRKVEELREKCNNLEKSLEKMKIDNNKLTSDNEKLKQENKTQQTEIRKQQRIDEERESLNHIRSELREKTKKIISDRQEVDKKLKILREEQKKNQLFIKDIEDKRTVLEKERTDIDNLRKEVEEDKLILEEEMDEIASERLQLSNRRLALDDEEEQLDDEKRQVADMIKALESEKSRLISSGFKLPSLEKLGGFEKKTSSKDDIDADDVEKDVDFNDDEKDLEDNLSGGEDRDNDEPDMIHDEVHEKDGEEEKDVEEDKYVEEEKDVEKDVEEEKDVDEEKYVIEDDVSPALEEYESTPTM